MKKFLWGCFVRLSVIVLVTVIIGVIAIYQQRDDIALKLNNDAIEALHSSDSSAVEHIRNLKIAGMISDEYDDVVFYNLSQYYFNYFPQIVGLTKEECFNKGLEFSRKAVDTSPENVVYLEDLALNLEIMAINKMDVDLDELLEILDQISLAYIKPFMERNEQPTDFVKKKLASCFMRSGRVLVSLNELEQAYQRFKVAQQLCPTPLNKIYIERVEKELNKNRTLAIQ